MQILQIISHAKVLWERVLFTVSLHPQTCIFSAYISKLYVELRHLFCRTV